MKEEISLENSLSIFCEHKDHVKTILVSEKTDSIFIGDAIGVLIEYSISTGKVKKNYGNIQIGWIISSDILGKIAIFGGRESRYAVLDIEKKRIIERSRQLPFRRINALQLFSDGWNKKNTYAIISAKSEINNDDKRPPSFIFQIKEFSHVMDLPRNSNLRPRSNSKRSPSKRLGLIFKKHKRD
jgi:hypothetical protein